MLVCRLYNDKLISYGANVSFNSFGLKIKIHVIFVLIVEHLNKDGLSFRSKQIFMLSHCTTVRTYTYMCV